jgi:glutathione S-transferase
MLTVHHLNNSRSQRILWLLEELELDYKVASYQRDGTTNLAPPALEAIHQLGKSPVLTDIGDGSVAPRTIIESGAIIDYVLRHYGNGRLVPEAGTDEYEQYLQWLHYAEGSAALPMMLKLYTSRLGAPEDDASVALQGRIGDEMRRHLTYLDQALEGVDWYVGNSLSGADIQLSFVAEIVPLMYAATELPNLAAFKKRCHSRPAYLRALDKGGLYAYGPPA